MIVFRTFSEWNEWKEPVSTVLRCVCRVTCSFVRLGWTYSLCSPSAFSVNYLLTASFTISEPHSDLIANYAVSTSLVTPAVRERLRSRLAARRYTGVILYLWNEAATLCVSSNLRRDGKSPFIETKRALQTDLIQPRRWCTVTKNWQIGFLVTSHLWAPCSWHYLIWVRKRGLRGPR